MDIKIGVGISYYGPAAPAHRDSIRDLKKDPSIGLVELHGSAYPEMAYAELFRAALADELDVIVLVSHRATFSVLTLKTLAQRAFDQKTIVQGHCMKPGAPDLTFVAVPRHVLEVMSEREVATYSNTGVLDTGYSNEKARPFASPWKQRTDGSVLVDQLVEGHYITPEQAFLTRAERAGFSLITDPLLPFNYLGHAPVTRRITLGDAQKRKAHDIAHNYAFCVPTFGGLDHHQQDALWQLEKAGCSIIELRDCPYIDQARSELTRIALDTGHDGIFFLDHDIIFRPIDALNMIAEAERLQDVVSGVYCMRKTAHSLIGATHVNVGTDVGFFELGALYPALYSGLGFSAIPKAVICALDEQLPLLTSDYLSGALLRPYYALDVNGSFYSGEDASFCSRVQGLTIKMLPGSANANGHDWNVQESPEKALTRHKVWLDTRVRIFHRGGYDYGIEDHSIVVPRYAKLKGTLVASRKEVRHFLADKMSEQAQARAQGVDVDVEGAPHGILEEQAPCKHCGCQASRHITAGLCSNCTECPGYEELSFEELEALRTKPNPDAPKYKPIIRAPWRRQ